MHERASGWSLGTMTTAAPLFLLWYIARKPWGARTTYLDIKLRLTTHTHAHTYTRGDMRVLRIIQQGSSSTHAHRLRLECTYAHSAQSKASLWACKTRHIHPTGLWFNLWFGRQTSGLCRNLKKTSTWESGVHPWLYKYMYMPTS